MHKQGEKMKIVVFWKIVIYLFFLQNIVEVVRKHPHALNISLEVLNFVFEFNLFSK